MSKVMQLVDACVTRQRANLRLATDESNPRSIQRVTKAAVEHAIDDVLEAGQKRIEALTAKINKFKSIEGAPAHIHSFNSLMKECDARIKSELKAYKQGPSNKEKKLDLFESVDQYDAFLKEASSLTASGAGIGGRTAYDPVFVALRQMNPMRGVSKQVATEGSTYQFRAKTGNAGAAWGYNIQNNGAPTTENTTIWQQNLQDLNVQFPIRTAALDDIDGLESSVIFDMMAEFSQSEAQSMVSNNDQGATSLPYGGSNGLRGLNQYAGQNPTYSGGTTTTAAFGTSGTGNTAGLHSIATYDQITTNASGKVNNVSYQDVINVVNSLPTQYRHLPLTWVINPSMLGTIRALVDANGTPIFERSSPLVYTGTVGWLLGYPVVVNQYLDNPNGSGTAGTTSLYPIYFGAWDKGHSIVDRLNMVLRRFDQTLPGNITFYGEKRVATSVVDPFAIVRYRSTATAN